MEQLQQRLDSAVSLIRQKTDRVPQVAMVLGSGLGFLAGKVRDPVSIPYSEIPYFEESTVHGHEGRLVIGGLEGLTVAILSGRVHLYEGHPADRVVFPVRAMAALGATMLLITNAAGGVNRSFQPGDLMLITDHINRLGTNPLIGDNPDDLGPRFPDMSEAYDRALRDLAREAAAGLGIDLKEGVYLSNPGPSYETPAEVRAYERIGADAVGMSTVLEVIAARHMGTRVLGISCITNMAAGVLEAKLSHDEVAATADAVKEVFVSLVRSILRGLGEPAGQA